MTTVTYTCEACQGIFRSGWSDEKAQAEARSAFSEQELVDTAVVCDDCWREMRAAMPDLDERYDDWATP